MTTGSDYVNGNQKVKKMGKLGNKIKICLKASLDSYDFRLKPEDYKLDGFVPIKIFDEAGVQGLIHLEDTPDTEIMLIVFTGTDEFIDAWRDIRIKKKIYPYGNPNSDIKVYDGVMSHYFLVRSIIQSKVRELRPKEIWITGHSLGGATATVCAIDLQFHFDPRISCITFGSPKVGNKEFAESYNKRIPNHYRVVNNGDIVEHLPRWWMGYRHVGMKLTFNEHHWNWKELFSKNFWEWLFHYFKVKTEAHMHEAYRSILDELMIRDDL